MTTIEDLVKWDQNFNDAKVGGQAVVDQMLVCGELNDGTKLNYACGLIVGSYKGMQMIHHGGAWAGYRTHMVRFPERRLSVFVLGNLSSLDTWNLAGRVDLRFLDGEADSETKHETALSSKPNVFFVSERKLARWAGAYTNFAGRIRHIQLTNGHLVLIARGAARELIAISEGRFTLRDMLGKTDIRLASTPGKNSRQMIIAQDDEPTVTWIGVEPKAARLALTEYAGTYGSEELNVRYVINVAGETLRITGGKINYVLTPEFADGFASANGTTVKFRRDNRKRIVGFNLSTGRANGLLFEPTGRTQGTR